MNFLALSVIFSVSVSVLLKITRRHNISIEVAIGVNYIVATLATWLFLKPSFPDSFTAPSYIIMFGLGILLPSIFVVMGRAVRYAGIVKSDAAQRLSLIIPIILSFTFFGETPKLHAVLGIVVAFIALGCLLHRPHLTDSEEDKTNENRLKVILLLLLVWFGYGTIDVLFKQMAKQGNAFPTTLLLSFLAAGSVMWIYLIYSTVKARNIKNKETLDTSIFSSVSFNISSIIGGVILGILNFGNIYTYIKAHIGMSDNPSIVFAGMNMGVISLGTIVGALFFKEKISLINIAGVVIALVSIYMLMLW